MPRIRSILDKAKVADLRPPGVLGKRLRNALDGLGELFSRLSRQSGDEVERHVRLMDVNIKRRNWQVARDHALALGLLGERLGKPSLIKKAGRSLRRLGGGHRAWQLIATSKRLPNRLEWDGGDLAGRTLLVERRDGDLAIFFQFASLMGPAIEAAGRCIIVVEPRLAALYRRTYPRLDVMIEGAAPIEDVRADVFAGFETLATQFWPDDPSGRAPFVPLKPDRELASQLRNGYLARGPGPLIGIAWGSLNRNKELPSLSDWQPLFELTPATFVCLQYGNVVPALATLERLANGRIIHDTSVDQLSDMDRFAAQIAALDAVVTISNTGANLAGALGVPTVVMLDDQFRLSWPAFGSTVAAYPSIQLIRKNRRAWRSVVLEAREFVAKLSSGLDHG